MNKVAVQICKQITQESERVVTYLSNIDELIKSGEENAVENVELFEGLAIDGVSNLQKLVVALTNCFFQKDKEDREQ